MSDLRLELIEINYAIDMIDIQLAKVNDVELEEQRDKLVEKRREIIKRLEGLQ